MTDVNRQAQPSFVSASELGVPFYIEIRLDMAFGVCRNCSLSGLDEVDGLLPRRVKCHDAVVMSRNEESRP